MLDFTSAAYLGLRHGSEQLTSWSDIAAGRPAALCEPRLLVWVGRQVAELQGEEDGIAGPSSLVLAIDALGPALRGAWRVLVDGACYPVLQWAALQRGVKPIVVAHHRPAALADALATIASNVRPVLAVDGFCVGCGRVAPLGVYAAMLAQRGGRLLVDDTQALGIIGPNGAGTPARDTPPGTVLRLTSLAKAFNAPLAVLSGSRRDIDAFRECSATRVHCGPPSIPVALAALRALTLNASVGGRLRAALRARVLLFRRACAALSVPLGPGLFPVQTIACHDAPVSKLVDALAARAMQVFASCGPHDQAGPRLRLIVTAAHAPTDVLKAAALLASVLRCLTNLKTEGAYAWTL
jgi:8-amino-7-oxononanoate synthase